MRKFFTILLIVLVLISSIHLTVATHFCGGKFSAARVGLEGTKASCGMAENYYDKNTASQTEVLYSHCCKNISKVLEVDNFQVFPSMEMHQISLDLLQVFVVSVLQITDESPLKSLFFADVGLRHTLLAINERLACICVFRK